MFMKILKMYGKVKYCEVNKTGIYALQTALTFHVTDQKEVKICKISPYCVSHAEET
jgi:hypothetical protein